MQEENFPYIASLPLDYQGTSMSKDTRPESADDPVYGGGFSHQIVNQMPFPVEVCDPDGKTIMVNAAFLDTFEVPPAGRILGQLRKHGPGRSLEELKEGKKAVIIDLTVEPGDLAATYGTRKGPALFETTIFPVVSPLGKVLRIVALWKDVTERRRAEARVQSSLEEKELLVKEIHHRVKNNLQVVCSLLSLQGSAIRERAVRRLFDETRDRVRSMASIHEMLYQSTDFARVDFSGYISTLASQLFSSCNISSERVKLETRMEPVSLGISLGVPCGLLINELMTNALVHAFPGNRTGTIAVSMGETPDHSIRLSVRDDGIGLPPDLDIENTDTLGFQLVTTLVGQLNGTLEVKRERGTEFIVLF